MGKKSYSPETQAAVMSALLEGQAVSKVAKDYKIPYSTVHSWKDKAENGETPKAIEIGELLLEYLKTNLETLKTQSLHFRDKDWLKEQSASELGVLHGIIADKTIRILEAYGAQEESRK